MTDPRDREILRDAVAICGRPVVVTYTTGVETTELEGGGCVIGHSERQGWGVLVVVDEITGVTVVIEAVVVVIGWADLLKIRLDDLHLTAAEKTIARQRDALVAAVEGLLADGWEFDPTKKVKLVIDTEKMNTLQAALKAAKS